MPLNNAALKQTIIAAAEVASSVKSYEIGAHRITVRTVLMAELIEALHEINEHLAKLVEQTKHA